MGERLGAPWERVDEGGAEARVRGSEHAREPSVAANTRRTTHASSAGHQRAHWSPHPPHPVLEANNVPRRRPGGAEPYLEVARERALAAVALRGENNGLHGRRARGRGRGGRGRRGLVMCSSSRGRVRSRSRRRRRAGRARGRGGRRLRPGRRQSFHCFGSPGTYSRCYCTDGNTQRADIDSNSRRKSRGSERRARGSNGAATGVWAATPTATKRRAFASAAGGFGVSRGGRHVVVPLLADGVHLHRHQQAARPRVHGAPRRARRHPVQRRACARQARSARPSARAAPAPPARDARPQRAPQSMGGAHAVAVRTRAKEATVASAPCGGGVGPRATRTVVSPRRRSSFGAARLLASCLDSPSA